MLLDSQVLSVVEFSVHTRKSSQSFVLFSFFEGVLLDIQRPTEVCVDRLQRLGWTLPLQLVDLEVAYAELFFLVGQFLFELSHLFFKQFVFILHDFDLGFEFLLENSFGVLE